LKPAKQQPIKLSDKPKPKPTGWVCPKCDGVNAPNVLACPCSTARAPSGPAKNVPPKQTIDEVLRTLPYREPRTYS
jgi:hypothetical protein